MEKYMDRDKVMTATEAVNRFITDGDSLVFANCLTAMPLALVHEVIRAGKRNLMVFQQGGIEEIDLMVEAGLIDRLVLAYNFRVGGKRLTPPLDRALKEKRVRVQEMTNFTLLSMMKAGAMGYNFIPVLPGIRVTDVVKRKGLLGDDCFGEVRDPFNGESVLVVKGYNPDCALMHVQRADRAGNGQLWGAMINSKWAALAAKKIILSTEKIVDREVIQSAPHLTIAPAHKVCAVVECPWGAHPSEIAGYYDYDLIFRALFYASVGSPDAMKAWMDEWIYNIPGRPEYVSHYLEKFGKKQMDRLLAQPFPSVPADYGFPFTREWDDQGYSEKLGMNMAEFLKMLDERGVLLEG